MSIEDAIDLIRSKYEDNKGKKWVQNPVAYTLYEVWKIVDSKVVYHPSETAPAEDINVPGTYDLLYEEGGPDTR
jgi:hypothetical protein